MRTIIEQNTKLDFGFEFLCFFVDDFLNQFEGFFFVVILNFFYQFSYCTSKMEGKMSIRSKLNGFIIFLQLNCVYLLVCYSSIFVFFFFIFILRHGLPSNTKKSSFIC